MSLALNAWYMACGRSSRPRPECNATCRLLGGSARGSHRRPAEGGTAPFAPSRADAPDPAGSSVGRDRTRLPTILVVPLGRLAAYPEPGSAMLNRLAVQCRGEGRVMPGPLQVIAVSFSPGSDFEARVLAEVDRLQGRGVLRLLDVIFVAKNADGTIERVVVGGDDDDLGALLSSILPLGGGGLVEPTGDAGWSRSALSDAWALAESLLPGTALALLLVEHGWAQALFEAVSECGGALLGEGFLTAEAGMVVGAEVAALEEAAEVIAVAQAAEARATLAALAAETQAADAIAASEAIVAGAAAVAVRAS